MSAEISADIYKVLLNLWQQLSVQKRKSKRNYKQY